MGNTLLTTSKITRESVMLFLNSNMFLQSINRQHDSEFGKAGEKIGSQLRIRLPNDYTVTDGPALSAQDTAEVQTVLTVATQKHVDLTFTTADLLLSIDDFGERILEPAMNNLAGAVALAVSQTVDKGYVPASSGMPASPLVNNTGGTCNLVGNFSGVSGNSYGSSTLGNPTLTQILSASAYLADNSAPDGKRKLVWDPWSEARIVGALSGLYNPAATIGEQYKSGKMKNAANFDHFMDQTVIKHTNGTFSAGTVNSGSQTGSTLTVNAITGTLNVGDIITIAGVNAVNRITKQDTGNLRQFVITAAASNGATSLSIYPAIIPASGGNAVQYQTVTASPLNSAAIYLQGAASLTYRKNIAFAPEAITMATGDLPLPPNVDAARAQYDGISLRLVNQYLVASDTEAHRCDILFGALLVRPEWSVAICDAL